MGNFHMKKSIVITSIFPPTEAVFSFSKLEDHHLIVIGDRKTPLDWHCDNVNFISLDVQESMDYDIIKTLPYNHYCRKMVGYLKAIEKGAEYIVDTDDDNIPKPGWSFPAFEGSFDTIPGGLGFVNVYQLFTSEKIWPRGLPLRLINTDFKLDNQLVENAAEVGIWQGLADEDPDVDAIYRLTNDTPCYFNDRRPFVLGKGTVSPFNTQNTIIRKKLFALLYLPTYVTFRYTDILRGLVAQPIMWLSNYHLGFTNSNVVQKRNPHDYMKDFISEIPMYETGERVIELVSKSISPNDNITDNLYNAYHSLLNEKIIIDKEMGTLVAWLKDIKKLGA